MAKHKSGHLKFKQLDKKKIDEPVLRKYDGKLPTGQITI
jgi:hypothetical protein